MTEPTYNFTSGIDTSGATMMTRTTSSALSFIFADLSGADQENVVFKRYSGRRLDMRLANAAGGDIAGNFVLDMSGGVISAAAGTIQFVNTDLLSAGIVSTATMNAFTMNADTLNVSTIYLEGNMFIGGAQITISTQSLLITDNVITLNAGLSQGGAGIVVEISSATGANISSAGLLYGETGYNGIGPDGVFVFRQFDASGADIGGVVASLDTATFPFVPIVALDFALPDGAGSLASAFTAITTNAATEVANVSTLTGHVSLNAALEVADVSTLTSHVSLNAALEVADVSTLTSHVTLNAALEVADVSTLTSHVTLNAALEVADVSTLTSHVTLNAALEVADVSTLTSHVTLNAIQETADITAVNLSVTNLSSDIGHAGYLMAADLSTYATQDYVNTRGFLTGADLTTINDEIATLDANTNRIYDTDLSGNVANWQVSASAQGVVNIRAFDTKSGGTFATSSFTSMTLDASGAPHLVVGISSTVHDTNTLLGSSTAIYAIGDLVVTGGVTANSYTTTSDGTLKRDIEPITGALAMIQAMRGVSYNWKDSSRKPIRAGHKEIGLIAQEVESVIPNLVGTTPGGYKAVAYDRVVSLLIEAVKELSSRMDTQEQSASRTHS